MTQTYSVRQKVALKFSFVIFKATAWNLHMKFHAKRHFLVVLTTTKLRNFLCNHPVMFALSKV